MEPIEVVIPGSGISVNDMYCHARGHVVYKSRAYKQFESLVGFCVGARRLDFDGLIGVDIHVVNSWFTQKGEVRSRDLDNFATKPLIDSLAKSLGFNDKRIFEIHQQKVEGSEPKIIVRLYPLTNVA